jgi:hypothetical protein
LSGAVLLEVHFQRLMSAILLIFDEKAPCQKYVHCVLCARWMRGCPVSAPSFLIASLFCRASDEGDDDDDDDEDHDFLVIDTVGGE